MVAGAVRDMTLAVDAEHLAVSIDDGDRVEARPPRQLEEAHRQHHLQFSRYFLEMLNGRILLYGSGQLQIFRVRLLAEIRSLEELLNQDDLCALGGCLADQLLGVGDVRFAIPGTGHLGGGDRNDTGHGKPRGCWRKGGPVGRCEIYSIIIWIESAFDQRMPQDA